MFVKFDTKLELTPDPGNDDLWYTDRSLRCDLWLPDGVLTLTVPKNFVTDLASVPRVFWCVFPPFGRWSEAAVLHDFLYRDGADEFGLSRSEADGALLGGMLSCGVPKWRAYIMYGAVRCFGWMFFQKRKSPK